jgi:hypothetical protein
VFAVKFELKTLKTAQSLGGLPAATSQLWREMPKPHCTEAGKAAFRHLTELPTIYIMVTNGYPSIARCVRVTLGLFFGGFGGVCAVFTVVDKLWREV